MGLSVRPGSLNAFRDRIGGRKCNHDPEWHGAASGTTIPDACHFPLSRIIERFKPSRRGSLGIRGKPVCQPVYAVLGANVALMAIPR